MTDGPKAPKRARVDEPDVRQIVKCDDLYFVDGNIILRAYCADKRAHSLFRVHKSLLALNCLFFRDLFGDSSDSSNLFDASSDKYDGLPVMDMQDDPQDVESFLRALYIPGYVVALSTPVFNSEATFVVQVHAQSFRPEDAYV